MLIKSHFSVDEERLLTATGIDSLENVVVTLEVDCPATGYRAVKTFSAAMREGPISLPIPEGVVAQDLKVRTGCVLGRSLPGSHDGVQPTIAGSRIVESVRDYRFILEGQGSSFPVEAFDFNDVGLPKDSAWYLRFEPESLDDLYLASVRLFVNSAHPQADEILSGKSPVISSVLFHSVMEQLLTTGCERFSDDLSGEWAEGSVGEVLSTLSSQYLDLSLEALAESLRSDRSEILARLQAASGFLRGDKR